MLDDTLLRDDAFDELHKEFRESYGIGRRVEGA
jgi:hypothetical protein